MADRTISELEEKIAEIKQRIPPHSVPPAMLQELDELEQELEQARPKGDQD
ncbi:MAG: histidine kinase [Dehalococcoidia bacterium]